MTDYKNKLINLLKENNLENSHYLQDVKVTTMLI